MLKAGGAYLPIEAGSPARAGRRHDRRRGARLVLTTTGAAAGMPALAGVEVVAVGTGKSLRMADERAAPPDLAHPLSLAYISFTSGSTGVPKGVAVPQRAVIRLISDPVVRALGPGERLLHLAPVAFDASTLEIWGALLTGATVVIAPPGPLGLPDIAALLRSCRRDGRLADRRAVPPARRDRPRRDRRASPSCWRAATCSVRTRCAPCSRRAVGGRWSTATARPRTPPSPPAT